MFYQKVGWKNIYLARFSFNFQLNFRFFTIQLNDFFCLQCIIVVMKSVKGFTANYLFCWSCFTEHTQRKNKEVAIRRDIGSTTLLVSKLWIPALHCASLRLHKLSRIESIRYKNSSRLPIFRGNVLLLFSH